MIRLIVTDFDGTLVDTFEANLRAYQEAFRQVGIPLTTERYRECFGYRFDRFMAAMAIDPQTAKTIKEVKKNVYPNYFEYLCPNKALIALMGTAKAQGIKTAIASTARKENLMNAVAYLGIADNFDLIFAGVDVKQGKPSPEIYLKVMEHFGISAEETLIFEDSAVGIEAAKASGAKYMVVPQSQFE
jgi:HAD superfamily hydrolase (TIGR01509 family)